MSCEVGTTTICSADALTNSYALMDDDLQTVDGTNKWFQLYAETQKTLDITYTTGAAETNNYVEFYIEFGSGAVSGRPNLTSTMTWARETMEYFDDSANQIVLEEWTYRIDGASAATAYTKRIQLPVCTKGIRIYAKEVGVVANYGTLTIKANTQAAGANIYNRSLQTVTLEASGITIGDVRITDGTDIADVLADYAETLATTTNGLATFGLAMGLDADAGTPILRALQVAVDNATVSTTPNVLITGGIYKAALDTYDDNDATPFHFNSKGCLLSQLNDGTTAVSVIAATAALKVDISSIGGAAVLGHGDSVGTEGVPPLYEAKNFDGSALPNNVTEGQFARGAVTLYGVPYSFLVNSDGSWSPLDSSTQAIKTVEQAPIYTRNVGDTLANVTNETSGTNYYYFDMSGYRYAVLQAVTSGTTPTDTLTITIEATAEDNGTAQASCSYFDVTSSLFGVASWVDQDIMLFFDTPTQPKYYRVKTVTAGGANDADYELLLRRFY